VCVCVCHLFTQHAMRTRHIVICDLSGSTTLLRIIHRGHDFGKKELSNTKLCFDFLHNFCLNISHSKKDWARYNDKLMQVFIWSARYSCQIIMKLELSRQIFEKRSDSKFHDNPSSAMRTDGRTDRRDETKSLFSKFCGCTSLHYNQILVGLFLFHFIYFS
jgi:hypothetical protein